MKSLPIDTAQFRFLVVNEAQAVLDFATKAPKADRDGQPLYSVEVLASREGYKGEVITVKIAGAKPTVTEGQKIKIPTLEAMPWENNGRSGLSFSAERIESLVGATGKAA